MLLCLYSMYLYDSTCIWFYICVYIYTHARWQLGQKDHSTSKIHSNNITTPCTNGHRLEDISAWSREHATSTGSRAQSKAPRRPNSFTGGQGGTAVGRSVENGVMWNDIGQDRVTYDKINICVWCICLIIMYYIYILSLIMFNLL